MLVPPRLRRRSLGGQGGRCADTPATDEQPLHSWSLKCDEECDLEAGRCVSPPEIYLRNVGTLANGDPISLRITNETECVDRPRSAARRSILPIS